AIAMARRYECSVTGIDISPPMLAEGRRRAAAAGVDDRVELIEGRAESLPLHDGAADAVTCTYVLRYVDDVGGALRELARVARPGAPAGYSDSGGPPSAPARVAWEGYTRACLPLAGRLIGHGWHEVGSFLNGSIRRFGREWPPDRLAQAFARAGIVEV